MLRNVRHFYIVGDVILDIVHRRLLSVPVTVHDEMSSSSDASAANEVTVPSAVMSIVIMHKRTATDNVFFNLISPCFHLPLISHKCVRL